MLTILQCQGCLVCKFSQTILLSWGFTAAGANSLALVDFLTSAPDAGQMAESRVAGRRVSELPMRASWLLPVCIHPMLILVGSREHQLVF